jgi:hypothetical protein
MGFGSSQGPVMGLYDHGRLKVFSGPIKGNFLTKRTSVSLSRRILLHTDGWLLCSLARKSHPAIRNSGVIRRSRLTSRNSLKITPFLGPLKYTVLNMPRPCLALSTECTKIACFCLSLFHFGARRGDSPLRRAAVTPRSVSFTHTHPRHTYEHESM